MWKTEGFPILHLSGIFFFQIALKSNCEITKIAIFPKNKLLNVERGHGDLFALASQNPYFSKAYKDFSLRIRIRSLNSFHENKFTLQ